MVCSRDSKSTSLLFDTLPPLQINLKWRGTDVLWRTFFPLLAFSKTPSVRLDVCTDNHLVVYASFSPNLCLVGSI